MRIEDMTSEMVEEAKRCVTPEERMAFIRENGIELTDEQLEGIAGGAKKSGGGNGGRCPESDTGHNWKETGRTKPGRWIGIIDDVEYVCTYCGETVWGLW